MRVNYTKTSKVEIIFILGKNEAIRRPSNLLGGSYGQAVSEMKKAV